MVTQNDSNSNYFALKSNENTNNPLDKETPEDSDIKNQENVFGEINDVDNNSKDNDQNTNLLINDSKRSFANRVFGQIGPGSIRGSIFNLTIMSLGSGCLSLPKSMSEMSLILGVISIFLTGLATYWTLNLLSIVGEEHQIFNYSVLARKLCGKTIGLILDLSIFIYILGILILYQVVSKIIFLINIVFKLLGEVVYTLGGFSEQYENIHLFLENSFWNYSWVKLLVMYGLTCFIIMPLCLLKDVSKLRIGSLMGVLTLIFLIVMILIQCPDYIKYYWEYTYDENDPSTHLNIFNLSSSFDSNLFFLQGTATMFFSYTSHLGAFPIFGSLTNNNNRRVNKVILRTILLDSFFFLIIAIFGYLTWPINTPSLIIERDNIQGETDIFMSLGKLGLIIIIIMKLPVSFNAFRTSFYEMVLGDSNITNKK